MFMRIGNLAVVVFMCLFGFAGPALAHSIPVHHDLEVTLHPFEQRLTGDDTLKVKVWTGDEVLLTLAEGARVSRVSIGEKPVPYTFRDGRIWIPVHEHLLQDGIKVHVSYEAFFRDAVPRDPAYTEDPGYGVLGVISPEGTFLLSGAGWYPDLPGSRPTFRVRVKAPAGYEAVTAGRRISRKTEPESTTSVWQTEKPVRGLNLSAGPYLISGQDIEGIPIYTYFFPEDNHLSGQYFEATAGYLRLYADLFGPYPFEKFAVVENFFPTGYGFPSYTLLGRTVVRLPFILETSLGHEVSHAWWGNGVLVEQDQGNWSEGLATYVADHLFKERLSVEEAREYRLKVLRDYATLVSPENDFPLKDFMSRTSPWTHAVGYGKGLMVFHMARSMLGDEAFWKGLREVCDKKLFQRASWDDFALAFERVSGRDLRPFFRQWVTRPGAPRLALEDVKASKEKGGWIVTGRLTQQAPFYNLEVPLRFETEMGNIDTRIFLTGDTAPIGLCFRSIPRRLVADPGVDLFRRLDPEEVPAVINGMKGSGSLVAVTARHVSRDVVDAFRVLLEGFGHRDALILSENEAFPERLEGHDILCLGVPDIPDIKDSMRPLPKGLSASRNRFTVAGVTYDDPGDALFMIFSKPRDGRHVVGLYLPLSAKAAAMTARKVSHYGKYSYLVFRDGVNQVKATWPVSASPLTHVFTFREAAP